MNKSLMTKGSLLPAEADFRAGKKMYGSVNTVH
jgi:hypothetical protein